MKGCIAGGGFFTGTRQCDIEQSGALQLAAAVPSAAAVTLMPLLMFLLRTKHQ